MQRVTKTLCYVLRHIWYVVCGHFHSPLSLVSLSVAKIKCYQILVFDSNCFEMWYKCEMLHWHFNPVKPDIWNNSQMFIDVNWRFKKSFYSEAQYEQKQQQKKPPKNKKAIWCICWYLYGQRHLYASIIYLIHLYTVRVFIDILNELMF